MRKISSDQFVSASMNRNVEWINNPFSLFFYAILFFVFFLLCHVSGQFLLPTSITITNAFHTFTTFLFFHWIKGSPDNYSQVKYLFFVIFGDWICFSQGDFNGMTFYEQIDDGVPYTAPKKFLMLYPTLITLGACYASNFAWNYLLINLTLFLLCILPKVK